MNIDIGRRDIELSPARDAALRHALVEHVAAGTGVKTRRRWRPVLFIAIPSIIVAGGLTAGAFALLRPVSDQNSVHCFSRAEVDIFGRYPGASVALAAPNGGGPVSIEDAIEMCSQVWRDGLLSPTDPIVRPPGNGTKPYYNENHDSPVPDPLTVCVMGDGTAAVVPGGPEVCSVLRLAGRQ